MVIKIFFYLFKFFYIKIVSFKKIIIKMFLVVGLVSCCLMELKKVVIFVCNKRGEKFKKVISFLKCFNFFM